MENENLEPEECERWTETMIDFEIIPRHVLCKHLSWSLMKRIRISVR